MKFGWNLWPTTQYAISWLRFHIQFTFQVIVNNELNFSAQNTHFSQQEDSVKMCFILYTLGLDATKGSAILYNMVYYLSCNVTSTWLIRASSEFKPRSTSLSIDSFPCYMSDDRMVTSLWICRLRLYTEFYVFKKFVQTMESLGYWQVYISTFYIFKYSSFYILHFT